jgi:hypothetical protein
MKKAISVWLLASCAVFSSVKGQSTTAPAVSIDGVSEDSLAAMNGNLNINNGASQNFQSGIPQSLNVPVTAQSSQPGFGNLGAASGFSVLAVNGNVCATDSSFQSGTIGVAASGFSYSQIGSQGVGTQQATTAFINSASWVGLHPQSVAINQSSNAFLQQAVIDATNASNTLASLTPTQTLGNITCATTITEGAGHYVFDLNNINLNQAALTFNAPKGTTLVINISGSVTLNGGFQQGNGLLLTGGITPSNVIYNVTGGGTVTTLGGNNTQKIEGSILDLKGGVELHSGQVIGQIIAKYLNSSCGTSVISP